MLFKTMVHNQNYIDNLEKRQWFAHNYCIYYLFLTYIMREKHGWKEEKNENKIK